MQIFRRAVVYPLVGLILGVQIAASQSVCAPLLLEALRTLDQHCAATGANQACYGFDALEATYRFTEDLGRFDAPAEILDVERLTAIRTGPLDVLQQHWGLALLRLRANVPNALPGQLVSMLVMGGAELSERGSLPEAPMQYFQLSTSATGTTCSSVPISGLTIQSPRGLQMTFSVNGAEFNLGSTVYFDVEPNRITLSTLAGRVRIGDRIVPVGFSVRGDLTETGDLDPDSLSDVAILDPEDAAWSQVLAASGTALFAEEIDALTPELLQALSAIDFDWLEHLDPYLLTDILSALLEQGVDPMDLDDIGLLDFYNLVAALLVDDVALLDALLSEIDDNGAIIFDLEKRFGVIDDDAILSLDGWASDADLDDLLAQMMDPDVFSGSGVDPAADIILGVDGSQDDPNGADFGVPTPEAATDFSEDDAANDGAAHNDGG